MSNSVRSRQVVNDPELHHASLKFDKPSSVIQVPQVTVTFDSQPFALGSFHRRGWVEWEQIGDNN